MTISGSFTVVGVSKALLVRAGQTASYTYTVDALETFNGLVHLQRSRDGGQSWQVVAEIDGRTVAIDPVTVTGTVANETTGREHYRFQCLDAGSAEEIDYTAGDAVDVEQTLKTAAGVGAITVNDDGSVTITSIANLAALLVALRITTLPTADPTIAGALYTATGVVKVSAG